MVDISVIVPVYNVEDFLHDCVDSLLAQEPASFEILLIDDGSTDQSGAICDAYARQDRRIRVIHQKNAGLGGARNTGVREAAGAFLLFLDSDDTLDPHSLAYLSAQQKEKDADIVIFLFETVDENGASLSVIRENAPYGTVLSLKDGAHADILLNSPSACNRLYRKSLFTTHDILFPEHVWYEDIRTTLKLMLQANSILYCDRALYRYRMRQGSITKNVNADRNREILEAFRDVFDYFSQTNRFEAFRDELCFLTIQHVYLAASVRVIRIDRRHPLIREFAVFLQTHFPDYKKNKYLPQMDRNKRLIFRLLNRRMYGLIAWIFQIKG